MSRSVVWTVSAALLVTMVGCGSSDSPSSTNSNVTGGRYEEGSSVQLTLVPDNPSNDSKPQFTFTSPDTNRFRCSLDGGEWFVCASPFRPGHALSDGGHEFTVAAVIGEKLGGTIKHSWTIDTKPPALAFLSPPAGSWVEETISVSVSADDPHLSSIEIWLGPPGAEASERIGNVCGTSPCTRSWSTSGDGSSSLYALARDALGHTTQIGPRTVNRDNLEPAVEISAPAENAWVGGTVDVTAEASDWSLTGVELWVGVPDAPGSLQIGDTCTASPCTRSWTTSGNGVTDIYARATDAIRSAVADPRRVERDNTVPESLSVNKPTPFSLVTSSPFTLEATASDSGSGIAAVEFFVDEQGVGAGTWNQSTQRYELSWELGQSGAHTIHVLAVDNAGNQRSTTPFFFHVLHSTMSSIDLPENEAERAALGDLAGNGAIADIAVISPSAASILSNTGDRQYSVGSFQTSFTDSLGVVMTSLGDENTRGDLAVLRSSDKIAIYDGVGNGSFNFEGYFEIGQNTFPWDIIAERFRGPYQFMDIAVARALIDSVRIFPGTHTLDFGTPQDIFTGEFPISLASGRFNDDDYPDLAVGVFGYYYDNPGLCIHIGTGSASPIFNNLQHSQCITGADIHAGSLAVGRLVASRNVDDIVASYGAGTHYPGDPDEITILINQGQGTFEVRQHDLPQGRTAGPVGIGDFNRDGRMDLAVVAHHAEQITQLMIYLGSGSGSFPSDPTQSLNIDSVVVDVRDLKVADLDGNGTDDVVLVTNKNNQSQVRVLWFE